MIMLKNLLLVSLILSVVTNLSFAYDDEAFDIKNNDTLSMESGRGHGDDY